MGKIGNGNIKIVVSKGGLRPADEDSSHLILHCWRGPIPIPDRMRDEFLSKAKAHGNEVSFTIRAARLSLAQRVLSLFRRGRRLSSGLSL